MESARDGLIVATSEYRDSHLKRLRAPAADAQALASVLEDPSIGDFRVQLALDKKEGELRRRISRFFRDRRPEDLLLAHFSCHGVKDETGELYLAAVDTEHALLSATAISSRWLNEQIERCRSKHIVVFLDCCYSGSFPFGSRTRAGDQVNVHDHLQGRGRAVITASNSMEYSFEGDELSGAGKPSIFTSALVEGLKTGEADRDGDRWISVDELYDYVHDRVRDRTPNQTPTKLITLEGSLRLARSRYQRPLEPGALPGELRGLIEYPLAGGRLGAVEELRRLLTSTDQGLALAARRALEGMTSDDSRAVSAKASEALATESGSSESGEQPQRREERATDEEAHPLVYAAIHSVQDPANERERAPGGDELDLADLARVSDPALLDSVEQLALEQHLGAEAVIATLGVTLRSAGKNDQARAFLEAAASGDAMAANTLGLILEEEGDREGARREFRESAEQGDSQARYNLGRMYYEDLGSAVLAGSRTVCRTEAEDWLSRSTDPRAAELLQRMRDEDVEA
jgi:hypothetical protein